LNDKKNKKKLKEIKRELNKKVAVFVDKPQTPTDYLSLRLHLVQAKRGFFGWRDKVIAFTVLIPSDRREAAETFQKIQAEFKTKGVTL